MREEDIFRFMVSGEFQSIKGCKNDGVTPRIWEYVTEDLPQQLERSKTRDGYN